MRWLIALVAVLGCDEPAPNHDASTARARPDVQAQVVERPEASIRRPASADAGGSVAADGDAAATARPPPPPAPAVAPAPPVPAAIGAPWRARRTPPPWLCGGPIESIEPHSTGTNVLFVLRFAGGRKAAFKPDQRSTYSHFRSEIAAYQLSELLGYGRVPPACERSIPVTALRASIVRDSRLLFRLEHEVVAGPGGRVAGAAIEWIDQIRPWDVVCEQVAGHPLERALSDMIVFDALTGNYDRWSGTNVFVDPGSRALVLIDNAAAFQNALIPSLQRDLWRTLDCARSPSPRLLAALSALQRGAVARALGAAGYGDEETDGVMERRRRILDRLGVTPSRP